MTSPEWNRYARALPSISAAVGRTPLVRLNRFTADVKPAIYVKVEWYGATGSLKDRIYLHMFERAEARGDLKPGMSVLECSTGNAGNAGVARGAFEHAHAGLEARGDLKPGMSVLECSTGNAGIACAWV